VDFSNLDTTDADVSKVALGVLEHGVTAIVPTLVTSSPKVYQETISKLKARPGSIKGAAVLGVHLEGPFMSEHKFGAHNEKLLLSPSDGFESIKKVS